MEPPATNATANLATFESPLRIKLHTEFTAIRFGSAQMTPEVARLRQVLNDILWETTLTLPEPLDSEARSILSGYAGGENDFYRLFYVPAWSFLHWVPALSHVPVQPELLKAARTGHAMSLFLHLWDDHLVDQQLPLDLLRLQLRTLAWQHFETASRWLCHEVGGEPNLFDQHARAYLTSLYHPTPVSDLNDYCRRFTHQIAIWTVVPQLLGHGLASPEAAAQLCRIINSFAIAWRLLDDVQDIHLDLLQGEITAVWLELDEQGRREWASCSSHSIARGELDLESWAPLVEAMRRSGCLNRLLARIDEALCDASDAAAASGWSGLALELDQCRQGIPKITAAQ
jgi:hypothetical protein